MAVVMAELFQQSVANSDINEEAVTLFLIRAGMNYWQFNVVPTAVGVNMSSTVELKAVITAGLY